jgi:HK97 family phage major capsid protein
MADDLPYIVSEINQHAQYNLLLQEELQLLSGTGNNADIKGLMNRTGVQTLGQGKDADPDRIFHATTLISTATGFPADAVVINPTDYEAIRLSKDGNQQYYGGGFFAGQYGQGGILQNPALWGLRTIVTPSVPAGTVLVGAFKAGGMVFRKGGLRAESTNSNENDFTNDKITFRVKERLGLQVKYPAAFVSVALGLKTGA